MSRYLLAAAIILAVAIPVYQWQTGGDRPEITQSITLLPTRSSGGDALHLQYGGLAEIRFVIEGARPGLAYDIVISHAGGDTVFVQSGFGEFNPQGQGKILLDVTRLRIGSYLLSATVQHPDSVDVAGISYRFQVR